MSTNPTLTMLSKILTKEQLHYVCLAIMESGSDSDTIIAMLKRFYEENAQKCEEPFKQLEKSPVVWIRDNPGAQGSVIQGTLHPSPLTAEDLFAPLPLNEKEHSKYVDDEWYTTEEETSDEETSE